MQEQSLGAEAERFCPKQELYLSPLSRIEINIKLPKFTIPGQSISNWDLMERLKKGIAPLQFASIRVTTSSLEGVNLEADLYSKKVMKQVIKILESLTVKVSGFSDPVRVRASEAKSDFPRRHDWDLFFMKNKLDESKPGERPDTIYLSKVPIKWFAVSALFYTALYVPYMNYLFIIFQLLFIYFEMCSQEKGCDKPSEDLLRKAMESFGAVRMVDIPSCDELRKEMSPQISGIKSKGFSFGQDVFFEAYVQFTEYSGFANAMESFQNMKWTKRIDGKVFHANVKVDFDRTRHLSEAIISRRQAERERILAERRRIIEEEKRRIAEQEAEARRILEEKEMRREERERKRKEKYEAERLRKEAERLRREEEERLAKEAELAKQREIEARTVESRHLLAFVFARIQRKEDRRKEVQEARIRAEQRVVELEDIAPEEKEQFLRTMLLRQREMRMREELKEKMARALEAKASRPSSSRKTSEHDNSNGRTPVSVDVPSESESSPEPSRGKKLSSSASEGKSSKVDKRSAHRSRRHRSRRSVSSESDAAPTRKRRSEDSVSSDASRKFEMTFSLLSAVQGIRWRIVFELISITLCFIHFYSPRFGSYQDLMSDIAQRLRSAEERGVVLQILTEAKQEILWDNDCSALLEVIIDEIVKIEKYLTQTEISSCVDSCFSSANPLYAVPLLVSCLNSHQNSDRIIFWLALCLRENLCRTFKDSVQSNTDDFLYHSYVQFVNCLVFIREKSSNMSAKVGAVHSPTASLAVIENTLCSALCSCLRHVYDLVIAEKDVDLRVISLLVAKSRTVVVQDLTLLHYIMRWLCSQEESPVWDRIAQRIFTDESVGSRDAEALITAVALCASSAKDLMRCFGFSIRRNAVIRRVCCTKLFLQRVCDPAIVLFVAEYLQTSASREVYLQTIEAVVSVWSDPAHVRYVAIEQQMHLTRVVLALGRWINELKITNAWQKLFDLAIQGVEQRLANPDAIIRQSGMFVGETFSTWMGGERLEFEYQNDSWLQEMQGIRDGRIDEDKNSITVEQLEPVLDAVDMQMPTSSSSIANSQPVDSDDEEDFKAYDVPESERSVETLAADAELERTAPAPNYIRDCMEQLAEKEKYEVFEAAFFALDSMIRRKAVGFVDIAEQLVKKLVFLEDKFSTKKFEEIRKQCIISCLVMRPELAPKLGDIVFSRNCSFFHRYLILECFLAAAKELSEFQKESAKKIVEISKEEKENLNDWKSVVDARIRSHTRRFTTESKPEFTSSNRLAAVATLFFYPLLKTKTEEHLELKGRDSPFLARLLFCVSDILQKAANAPTVVRMAKIKVTLMHYIVCIKSNGAL
ncbi:hypothetical protein Y032_0069g370 [Ancylostoma ceylanicum]|uniref:Uncharacterized protein n=1 Tax=Ancylostoma ceylanicum TaxID=53326 RepID=A0A016TZF9_9BILA|nr:hypothetical protein Y032_0069g370 [Ancylostoma ceylanicum]